MTNFPNADDVLMGGGTAPPSAKWPNIGARVEGVIVGKPRTYHVSDYAPGGQGGALKYFPSGDPVFGIKVDVQTAERTAPDDTGIRRIYMEKFRMLNAVRDAVRLSGASGIEPGAWLSITWVGTEQPQSGGASPANLYAAEYRRPAQAPVAVPPTQQRPAPGTEAFDIFRGGQPAQAPPVNSPGPPPAWATGPAQTPPAQPQAPAGQPVNAPTHVGAATAAVARQMATQQAQQSPRRQIPASIAAAMANAGVDTSDFDITPG